MNRTVEDFILRVWRHRGVLSTLLLPLAWSYGVFSRQYLRTQARGAWRAPVPVVVIGNILVGGTGKTPVTEAVCKSLLYQGWHPGLVSRGYGVRVEDHPHLSDQDAGAPYLGDEPALLHQAAGAPVAVHPRRALAAQALLAAHPEVDVLISDDGLQHRALARDLEIIVQDARGTGNGRLLPAGPLREPASRLREADWLITNLGAADLAPANTASVQDTAAARSSRMAASPSATAAPKRGTVIMRLRPHQVCQLQTGTCLRWADWLAQRSDRTCSAAAGIGQPERFFVMLKDAGLTLSHTLPLPDHGHLDAGQLQGLPDAPIVITAKDAVKCAPPHDPRLWVVHAEAQFDDPSWLEALQDALCQLKDRNTHERDNRH